MYKVLYHILILGKKFIIYIKYKETARHSTTFYLNTYKDENKDKDLHNWLLYNI